MKSALKIQALLLSLALAGEAWAGGNVKSAPFKAGILLPQAFQTQVVQVLKAADLKPGYWPTAFQQLCHGYQTEADPAKKEAIGLALLALSDPMSALVVGAYLPKKMSKKLAAAAGKMKLAAEQDPALEQLLKQIPGLMAGQPVEVPESQSKHSGQVAADVDFDGSGHLAAIEPATEALSGPQNQHYGGFVGGGFFSPGNPESFHFYDHAPDFVLAQGNAGPEPVPSQNAALSLLEPFGFGLKNLWADLPATKFSNPPGQAALGKAQAYGDRPDVMSVEARPLDQSEDTWEKLKQAKLEALAEILEVYPDHEIYFLARDAEYLYDLGKVLLKGSADEARVHLINVSRENMRHPDLFKYLETHGLKAEDLAKGKKVLLVDTGFAGTIPRAIEERLPEGARGRIQTKLLASSNRAHGSTRAFLQVLNPSASRLDPGQMHGTIVSYEHMARYSPRANSFREIEGRWDAVSENRPGDDGKVEPEKAKAYMRDLRHFGEKPEVRRRFGFLRYLWSIFNRVKNKAALLSRLKAHLEMDKAMGEARAMDYLEELKLKGTGIQIAPEEMGLDKGRSSGEHDDGPSDPLLHGLYPSGAQLIKKHPQWKEILQEPQTQIPLLIAKGDYQVLGSLLDAVDAAWVWDSALVALAEHKNPQSAALVKALIKKNKPKLLDEQIAMVILSRSAWSDHPELVEALIDKGTADVHLAVYVLPRMHWAKHPELILRLMQKGTQDLRILTHVLTQTHWIGHPELMEALIRKGTVDQQIVRLLRLQHDWFKAPYGDGDLIVWTFEGYLNVEAKNRWSAEWLDFWLKALEVPAAGRGKFLADNRPYQAPQNAPKGAPAGTKAEVLDLGPAGNFEVLAKNVGHGKNGPVDKLRRMSDGGVFALKRRPQAEHGKLLARSKDWKGLSISEVEVIPVPGKDLVLMTWVEGKLLADHLDDPNFWQDPERTGALKAFIRRLAEKGVYVGDLNAKNLIDSKSGWRVIDSGSIRDMPPAEALEEYRKKLKHKWGKFAPGHESRLALESFLESL